MKAFRVFMIIGAAFIVLGVILSITAAALGAEIFSPWKNNGFPLITDSDTPDINEEYQEITSLDFEFEYSSVTIETGDKFSIEAYNVRNKLKTSEINGKWTIRENDRFNWWIPFGYKASTVKITLPEEFIAQKCKIEVGAGKLTADMLSAAELELDLGAGDMKIKNFQAEDIDADVGAGNLNLTGDITRKGDFNAGAANISLMLKGNQKDFDYDIELGLGNISVGDKRYSGIADKKINNDAQKKISLECGVGNIDVKFE